MTVIAVAPDDGYTTLYHSRISLKESCLTRGTQRRVVFFDLDGTLHQQDMFGTFMRYLLRRRPLNLLLVVPLLPVVGIGLLFKGRAARWPMSLLLWSITFGRSERTLPATRSRICAVVSPARQSLSGGSAAPDRLSRQ
ncbi:HAD hydrolase, family IF [Pantoea agglomerans]|uniref:HAD hydrolase, family IF n=1 Tax=Enterobacter agglomerans TaxID=549 RepID=A0A379AC66_ENTAG|nr:HAD hydrolase, family IF [Pantoea agglomerans]